jgi:uncharacterized protein (TIGR00375 family)
MAEKKGFICDLHLHSRFSRACSKDLNLENLEKWARIKGIDVLGTGDFSHDEWLTELKEDLEDREGIFYTKTGFRFILSWEVSLIYTQDRGRKVHLIVLAPSFEVVDKINSYLDGKGRRDYDGRPIFKISCEQFTKDLKEISDAIEIIPAHIWTPWFAVFGSMSGFDSLKEAFGSQADKIHAIETGISSTPEMNLRLKGLQDKTILSFSDAHSFWPWRLGREATIFPRADSYKDIIDAIRKNEIIGTIEVNPAYGKYHYDGHRACDFSSSPVKTKELNGICPKCNKPLVIGVDNRIFELQNFDSGKEFENKVVHEVLPLHEIISVVVGVGVNSKKVWGEYDKIIENFENEFNVLLYAEKEELIKSIPEKIVDLILKNREGKIDVKPGYDGVYGEIDFDGKG